MVFCVTFRGEIKDLFEKVTKDELEKSILSGDEKKQHQMRYLIQALPYHSDEIEAYEKVIQKSATTVAPQVAPEIPDELQKLLKDYGLVDNDGKPIALAPLPVSDDADDPSSLLENENDDEKVLSLVELQEKVRKASLVSAKDYEAFKPIDAGSKNVSSDMETFLKQFGLVDDTRKVKSIKSSKVPSNSNVPSIDSAYLLPGYSSLLDNIGITTINSNKNGKKTDTKTRSNVFRPSYKNKSEEEDYKKLEQLLETIRELERLNASLTEKEVERLNLQNFNFSESILSEGPDPLNYQIHYSALKNEVKRQEPTDEPTRVSLGLTGPLLESSLEATEDVKDDDDDDKVASVISTTSKTATTSTTTESSKTPVTDDAPSPTEEAKKNSLEDEIEPIDDPEPLPPPRRSGFYMLLDWNSFLEVGEDPDKISIRFDPKIGDSSRFLPVSVP